MKQTYNKKTYKTKKRLQPRIFDGINYVLGLDILRFHGKRWFTKWNKASGPGNTGIIVPPNDTSHGRNEEQYGIYFHDYIRFADLVDFGKPTYFD